MVDNAINLERTSDHIRMEMYEFQTAVFILLKVRKVPNSKRANRLSKNVFDREFRSLETLTY